jgi:hypothetical protein
MFSRRIYSIVSSESPPENEALSGKSNNRQRRYAKRSVVVLSTTILCLIVYFWHRHDQHQGSIHDSSSLRVRTARKPVSFSWLGVPHERFAIVQFDGRSPWEIIPTGPNTSKYMPTIHNVGSTWNHLYSKQHGHEYILYHWGNQTTGCRSNNDQKLAEAWCKIRAMQEVQNMFPDVEYFLYLDTDAVVDPKFFDEPLNNLLYNMTTQWSLNWDIDEKPFTLNMEGPSYWCRRVSDANFTNCINTGTVLWKRSPYSSKILQQWWQSADDSYEMNNPLGYKFRTETPWEQVKAQYLLKDPMIQYIQVVPQPHAMMQGLPGVHKDFCLSDCWLPPMWDQLGCFVLHYGEMYKMYGTLL